MYKLGGSSRCVTCLFFSLSTKFYWEQGKKIGHSKSLKKQKGNSNMYVVVLVWVEPSNSFVFPESPGPSLSRHPCRVGKWTVMDGNTKSFYHQIKALESRPPTVGVQCTSDKVGVEVSWFGKVQDAFQNRKSGSLCIIVVTIML